MSCVGAVIFEPGYAKSFCVRERSNRSYNCVASFTFQSNAHPNTRKIAQVTEPLFEKRFFFVLFFTIIHDKNQSKRTDTQKHREKRPRSSCSRVFLLLPVTARSQPHQLFQGQARSPSGTAAQGRCPSLSGAFTETRSPLAAEPLGSFSRPERRAEKARNNLSL